MPGQLTPGARPGAGLLLCYPIEDQPHVALTLRAEHLGKHAGQVSLPGGAVDAGESFEEAALREAREEIHLDTSPVRVLGRLSPIDIPVSGFVLHPVVGVHRARPKLWPNPDEVEQVLEVSIDALSEPTRQGRLTREWKGTSYDVPYFEVGEQRVWGATAMVLAEFLTVIGRPPAIFED